MNRTSSDCSDNFSTHSLTLTDSINGDLINNNQPTSSDTNQKYDKLIQDYVKLRSKLTILKKAYVELSDQSSQKDKSLRKNEQEIEGLNFRNQQLTGRVDCLQKELDQLKSKSSTSNQLTSSQSLLSLKSQPGSNQANNLNDQLVDTDKHALKKRADILEEELQHKINENATLHKRIHEIEFNCEQSVARLEIIRQNSETERLVLAKKLETAEYIAKTQIEKLQNDKIKLELVLSQKDNEIKALQLNECNSNSLLNNDNNYSVQVPSSNIQGKVFLQCIEDQIDCFTKIYCNLGERNNNDDLFSECNHLFSQKLVPIIKKFDPSNKDEIKQLFDEFVQCNKKILKAPLPLEHANGETNQEIKELNKKLKIQLNLLSSVISESYDNHNSFELEQLMKFEISTTSTSIKSDAQPFFSILKQLLDHLLDGSYSNLTINSKFINSLKSIVGPLDKILRILNEKLSIEYTLNYPTQLTMSNECLVSYLTQSKQSFEKIIDLLESSGIGVLELGKQIINSNIENLKTTAQEAKLKQANEKIVQLQKEVDDSERLKFKFDQLHSQLIHLQNVEKEQQLQILKLETEKDESLEKIKEDIDNENLEFMKNDYYIKKISSLSQQNQMLDSKAIFYYEEMKCMLERLKLQIDMNGLLEKDLNEVKDQLERTRSSYEIQMSTMSDHLIEITDKMNRQDEENEKLRHDLNNALMNSKGGKAKRTK